MIRSALLASLLVAAPAYAEVPDVDPEIFVGAPLLTNDEKYELTQAPEFQIPTASFPVIAPGQIKPTDAWNADDSAACAASGGIEIELPAARKTCLLL